MFSWRELRRLFERERWHGAVALIDVLERKERAGDGFAFIRTSICEGTVEQITLILGSQDGSCSVRQTMADIANELKEIPPLDREITNYLFARAYARIKYGRIAMIIH